jgi:UDP:flavonoid glycosyltransferase YjiC (YdhE family)
MSNNQQNPRTTKKLVGEKKTKKTLLFMAEAVTLAHFGRIMTLARELDPEIYEIVIASDPRYLDLEQSFPFTFEAIWSIPSSQFGNALKRGKPLYSTTELERYVQDDIALLHKVKPDAVIGDFRISLAVSARVAGVPYINIVNAYWSPYAQMQFPVPDLPFTKVIGLRLGQKLFNWVRPLAFAAHARPLKKIKRRYGLATKGQDLRHIYSDADYTLYPDIEELVPFAALPENHKFIGPVIWSARVDLPNWWQKLPTDKPVIFVSPGSSGQPGMLRKVLNALATLPATIIATGCEEKDKPPLGSNVFIADYLPAETAIARSDLVICNGGSLMTYQALINNVPIIGLANNMDQLLNMTALEHNGVGILLRSDTYSSEELLDATQALLGSGACKQHERINSWAEIFEHYDTKKNFQQALGNILFNFR